MLHLTGERVLQWWVSLRRQALITTATNVARTLVRGLSNLYGSFCAVTMMLCIGYYCWTHFMDDKVEAQITCPGAYEHSLTAVLFALTLLYTNSLLWMASITVRQGGRAERRQGRVADWSLSHLATRNLQWDGEETCPGPDQLLMSQPGWEPGRLHVSEDVSPHLRLLQLRNFTFSNMNNTDPTPHSKMLIRSNVLMDLR